MPLSNDTLRALGILDWEQISDEYEGADLLLGNGFSVNLAGGFSYGSLFGEFLDSCSPGERQIFEGFASSNFEAILQRIASAINVNEIFGIDSSAILHAQEQVRSGLVLSINSNHPIYDQLDKEALQAIATALIPFNDIFTVNYDLLLYHIIMLLRDMWNSDRSARPYNDYFWFQRNDDFLEFRDFQNLGFYKHVYYLHGALFLFIEAFLDLKVRKRQYGGELITTITQLIEEGQIPLFVSEGSPGDKLLAISNSSYLSFALRQLRLSPRRMVIYGTSLSDADAHIVEAIRRNRRPLAISIRVGEKSEDELEALMLTYRAKFPTFPVRFFDSRTLFAIENT